MATKRKESNIAIINNLLHVGPYRFKPVMAGDFLNDVIIVLVGDEVNWAHLDEAIFDSSSSNVNNAYYYQDDQVDSDVLIEFMEPYLGKMSVYELGDVE